MFVQIYKRKEKYGLLASILSYMIKKVLNSNFWKKLFYICLLDVEIYRILR